jgi:hypothetical protein
MLRANLVGVGPAAFRRALQDLHAARDELDEVDLNSPR